ncbi:nucleotidyltransferase domain-containing protein [Nocardioides sp.]|uniref:nucleotidyltransferase domain-containing protein n=1 Tax=Nocardioides sp. TaxID=35761 RepID=UPI0031FE7071|nr:nucleotidyltransferase [Nocardioides sp.]
MAGLNVDAGDAHRAVRQFADRLVETVPVDGLYVGGSLATGDHRPWCSDLDLVALIPTPLDRRVTGLVRRLHGSVPTELRLGCTYVPREEAADVAVPHPTWSHGQFFRRPLTAVARADLLRHGLVVQGPPAARLIPSVDDAQLRAGVVDELRGYWSQVVGRRSFWLRDEHVDLALLTMARARITLTSGELLTKSEALERLADLGVQPDLVEEIRRRRAGESVDVGWGRRLRRAREARRLTSRAMTRMLETPTSA